MKRAVLQLGIQEKKIRKKVFVTISGFPGLTSITMDDKTGKITVIGEFDIPVMVMKLRKICCVDLVSVENLKPVARIIEPGNSVMPMNQQNRQYKEYQPCYPNIYYHPVNPYTCSTIVEDEPNGCVIM